jgi:hypothetical protein
LSGGKRDNFDRWVVAVNDVEIMEIAPCRAKDDNAPAAGSSPG